MEEATNMLASVSNVSGKVTISFDYEAVTRQSEYASTNWMVPRKRWPEYKGDSLAYPVEGSGSAKLGILWKMGSWFYSAEDGRNLP